MEVKFLDIGKNFQNRAFIKLEPSTLHRCICLQVHMYLNLHSQCVGEK
jgi:hypothetical protein